MKKVVALSIIAIVAVGVVLIFAPIVYNPAIPPVCNFYCADSGSSANYRSVSAQFLGQGGTYWVTPYWTQYCISLWVISSNCPGSYGYFGVAPSANA